MGVISGAWSESSVNGYLTLECTVAAASVSDSYTLKTPARTLDPTKPWLLMVNTAETTLMTGTLTVDLWAGFDDDFALSGDTTSVVATSGAEIASAIMDNVEAEMLVIQVDPNYTGTAIQSDSDNIGIVNAGTAPYYIIHLDGASLNSADCLFKIIQRQ